MSGTPGHDGRGDAAPFASAWIWTKLRATTTQSELQTDPVGMRPTTPDGPVAILAGLRMGRGVIGCPDPRRRVSLPTSRSAESGSPGGTGCSGPTS